MTGLREDPSYVAYLLCLGAWVLDAFFVFSPCADQQLRNKSYASNELCVFVLLTPSTSRQKGDEMNAQHGYRFVKHFMPKASTAVHLLI